MYKFFVYIYVIRQNVVKFEILEIVVKVIKNLTLKYLE